MVDVVFTRDREDLEVDIVFPERAKVVLVEFDDAGNVEINLGVGGARVLG